MYECDKNQMPYCNLKSFKKSNLWEFWAIDRTWPTLDEFYCSHFYMQKKRYFRSLHKIWNKIISFDIRKKGEMQAYHGKSEEKGEFGSPRNESLCFKRGTLIMFGPIYSTHIACLHHFYIYHMFTIVKSLFYNGKKKIDTKCHTKHLGMYD
jgi:hypothetical protein